MIKRFLELLKKIMSIKIIVGTFVSYAYIFLLSQRLHGIMLLVSFIVWIGFVAAVIGLREYAKNVLKVPDKTVKIEEKTK